LTVNSSLSLEDQALLERYRRGVELVDEALANVTEGELDRTSDDEWSARMVVHHLADSETNSYLRLRRLLVEPAPTAIQGYDEALWASSDVLGYRTLDITESLEVFRAVRAASLTILGRITAQDLEREGVHSESGPYSLRSWLEIYAAHGEDHAAQIRRARGVAS
jgi:hypothetical protein